jgi:N-acetyl-alpha-D-muramate 1-phosphate uridylyltransferase
MWNDGGMTMPPLMIFAAGFGTRMGVLTAHQPKPMVPVAGRPLIDHALDIALVAGVTDIVLNLHYRGEQLVDHLKHRNLQFSWERQTILETGGGLRAALPLLGGNPVLTLNPDVVWTGLNPLVQLLTRWDAQRMDALLLLIPAARANRAKGDFALDTNGRIGRGFGGEDHLYVGAQMVRTNRLDEIPENVFSLNRLWDVLIADGRAFGIVHQGGWCDVGHPAGIAAAEALLKGADVS